MRPTRRQFLGYALAGGAALGGTLWLPRPARGGTAPIKRVVMLYGYGGIRWSATFDGQTDITLNPWGTLPWDPQKLKLLDPTAPKPQYDLGRLLLQKPLPFDDGRSWSEVLAYLKADNLNLTRPTLSAAWGGEQLPNYFDVANDIAVVRVSNNPGGTVDTDHGSASHTIATGYPSGQTGLTTALQHALRTQVGASMYDSIYQLPAVHLGGWGWDLGVGDYAGSRPLTLSAYGGVAGLPTTDPGDSVLAWGRKAEAKLDAAFQASRNALSGQAVANFINDKAHEHYVAALIDPALRVYDPKVSDAVLGNLVGGGAPVTNAMLAEVFGLSSDTTPAGDILFDVFSSRAGGTATPKWDLDENQEGLVGAEVVRMLQKGAPIVSVGYGNYDSHSKEVLGTTDTHDSTTAALVALARTLAALDFALKRIADPSDPSMKTSLWDTTVIVLTSEFGRSFDSDDGFYSQSDGGGSQHGAWSGWPVLGGPVAGGHLFTDAKDGGLTHQNQVFTTLMKGMGIEDANSTYLPYSQFSPLAGLIKGV
ncbi:MAG: DUF1501 domain-containing protein [Minicystis sp.]